jgi:hypothetical protein
MPKRVALVLLLAFITISCSNAADDEESNATRGGETKRFTSADRSSAGPAIQEYEFGRSRGRAIDLDGRVFYAEGRAIHVFFPGGAIGNIEEDDCAAQYEMVAEQTPTTVDIAMYRVLPKEEPEGRGCDGAELFVLVHSDLDQPLGDRTLTTNGNIVNPAFVDTRLEPTWIPDGWTEREGRWNHVRGGTLIYGQVTVEIQALADKPGSDIVRGNRNHVDVSIRGVNDGAVVTRELTGEHRLGFEEAGWFYDFVAQPSVDRDELIEFARAFEPPPSNRVSPGLPNEIGQRLSQSGGWQFHDGAGPIERSGISFPSDGSDESLRFTSDGTPADVLVLVTGCKVAAYRIVWNEDGFVIDSTFTFEETTDEACDFEATEGLVVTPLSVGEQILVQRDQSNLIRVILTPADPGQQPWTISLIGR